MAPPTPLTDLWGWQPTTHSVKFGPEQSNRRWVVVVGGRRGIYN